MVTIDEAIQFVIDRSATGQPAGYVVKPYVEFLDRSYTDLEIQNLLNQADLALADGIAILWAATFLYAGPRTWWRFLKTLAQIMVQPTELLWPLPARAAGITFTLPLLAAASHHHRRLFLVGSPKHQSIAQTATTLTSQYPNLAIVGTHTGTDPESPDGHPTRRWLEQLGQIITESQADIILIGTGFPRQEQTAAYLCQRLSHGVAIGEGGTFDYAQFGGKTRRAPSLLQRLGLEWLWRLLQAPSRIQRQLAIPRFIYRVWKSRH
jgi:N-acetylglucosaminyldiphosphoundecaprenol N-acetyl-beta-D-mannosaminyltransferase